MKRKLVFVSVSSLVIFFLIGFKINQVPNSYISHYYDRLELFHSHQLTLLSIIEKGNLRSSQDLQKIKEQLRLVRKQMKAVDIWLRYLDPLSYKRINGPLPVEWETEVFEKFEKPYKREGAGLTLAESYLEEADLDKSELVRLIRASVEGTRAYMNDSITRELKGSDHFFLCNRLFLLNLAAIYSTGFECPDTSMVIFELRDMLAQTCITYQKFNESHLETPLSVGYLRLFEAMRSFTVTQPNEYSQFDHFTFIKDYVNPLYILNQQFIKNYGVLSKSYVDYSLSKNVVSIFDKKLYTGQNDKGIFHRVKDKETLVEMERIGKLLFFDPILSGNNERSCASCHKPSEYFTDTIASTSLHFDHQSALPRNAPTLINVGFNHLIMMDGKHTSLQDQTKAVITSALEMGSKEEETLRKVLSCSEYKKAFKSFLKYTPEEPKITMDHIVSTITLYYGKFSNYYSPFDEAMNQGLALEPSVKRGFNLFMSKAQCATCHFVPQFNGVKPPFVNSEFEVIGVPSSKEHLAVSSDKGRHKVHEADETLNAFRTGSLRNSAHTAPYMHNGVFSSLEEVIDFYDAGGGRGVGLSVENQTLSSDSLKLLKEEKQQLIRFIESLSEEVVMEAPPISLPRSSLKECHYRRVAGSY